MSKGRYTGKLTVTEGVAAIITDVSVNINVGDKKYYFIPYWWEATDGPNVFIAHHLDGKLPEDLLNAIEAMRQMEPNEVIEEAAKNLQNKLNHDIN